MNNNVIVIRTLLFVGLLIGTRIDAAKYLDTGGQESTIYKTGGVGILEHPYSGQDLGPGGDYNGVELTSAYLSSADLSRSVLSHADLSHSHLGSADLSAAVLNGTNFYYADLQSADLAGADLRDADLNNADLTGVNLDSAELSGANLYGVISEGITGTPASLPEEWTLINGLLIGPGASIPFRTDFSGMDLRNVVFRGVFLWNVNFMNADLRGADLSGVYVGGSDFNGALIEGVTSYGIRGEPQNIPEGWLLYNGYLIGEGARWLGHPMVITDKAIYVDSKEWLGWLEITYRPYFWHVGIADWVFSVAASPWYGDIESEGTGWLFLFRLSEYAPNLWLVMEDNSNWGWSYGMNRWVYVLPGGLENGMGWVYPVRAMK